MRALDSGRLSLGFFRFGVAMPFYTVVYKIVGYFMGKPGKAGVCTKLPDGLKLI
jgi:hypothetical protein